jgi:integrase
VRKRKKSKEEEIRKKEILRAFDDEQDESGDEEEDAGGDDEEPKIYKNAKEEIIAEFGDELIGGYFGGDGKKRKRVKRLPVTLPRGECQQVMTAYTEGKWAFRNNLISRLMYTTGIRLAEEAGLNVADINYEDQTGFVRMGKEGKDRYVCIDAETLEMLKTWIGDKKPADSLFDLSARQIARIVEQAAVIAGVAEKYEGMKRRFSPHSLRHSFATHCYENGMKLFVLKKLMGHEYLGTTLIYVDTAMAFDREEYKKTGPMGGNDGQVGSDKEGGPK